MDSRLSKFKKVGLALALYLCASEDRKEIIKKKRKWMKLQMKERLVLPRLNMTNRLVFEEIHTIMRMEKETFYELLEMVGPLIAKQDTNMRQAVSAEERLAATIQFLATGRPYRDLRTSAIVSHQLLSKIIPETCRAIYKVLKKTIKLPSTEEEWKETAQLFDTHWQFNNCVGSIDGRHILIVKPAGSGSLFYNYKGTFSVALFAIVNANYEFMYVHAGANGCMSNEDIIKNTSFYDKLVNNELQLPELCVLPGTDILVPYVFVGDNAFALDTHIMNPFSERDFTKEENIFNYRLHRVKRTVDNTFGILASRFRIFSQPINLNLDNVNAVILASCALHNFLRRKSKTYLTPACDDSEDEDNGIVNYGTWRQDADVLTSLQRNFQTGSNDGVQIRNTLADYFTNVGKVTFQDRMINMTFKDEDLNEEEESGF